MMSTPTLQLQPLKVLTDPTAYTRCQISVPDLEQPLEAIQHEGRYYGLMKVFRDRSKALEVVQRLKKDQHHLILTPAHNGVIALWILEMDAVPAAKKSTAAVKMPLLKYRHQYRTCRIQLPDGDRCAAVEYEGRYYSFFRVFSERSAMINMVQKLEQRQHSCLVTASPKGYSLWAAEDEVTELRKAGGN